MKFPRKILGDGGSSEGAIQAWRPRFVFVDDSVRSHYLAADILSHCGSARIVSIHDSLHTKDVELLRHLGDDPGKISKEHLHSVARESLLLYDNPEICQQMTAGVVDERRCYNFLKIVPYVGVCRADCAYCWFKDPMLIPKVNVRFFDRLPGLFSTIAATSDRPTVLTFTHYKTDCFALEHITGFARMVADAFACRPGFFVQFITKRADVSSILVNPPTRGTIICFSLNAEMVAQRLEPDTSSIIARLHAARLLQRAGIPVILRIDPMFAFSGWESAYDALVDTIFDNIQPLHITVGTPRYQSSSEMRAVSGGVADGVIRRLLDREFRKMSSTKPGNPRAPDGNSFHHYFNNMPFSYQDSLRASLYSRVIKRCQSHSPGLSMGICEEPPSIWEACGLRWSGDCHRDCSCNFIVGAGRVHR